MFYLLMCTRLYFIRIQNLLKYRVYYLLMCTRLKGEMVYYCWFVIIWKHAEIQFGIPRPPKANLCSFPFFFSKAKLVWSALGEFILLSTRI